MPGEGVRMAQPETGRGVAVGLAVAFELSLGALALGVGWLLGHSPLSRESVSLSRLVLSGALGVAATLPMLLGLLAALACPLEPLVRLRRLVLELVAQLFPGAGWHELAFVSVAAGLGEELLFRGLVQDGLSRWIADPRGVWIGLAVASVAFGLAHPLSRLYVLLAMLNGAYLGWLLIATDSLVTPIVTHATYDSVALVWVSSRLRQRQRADPDAQDAVRTG